MATSEQLKQELLRIDGKGYKAYKDIKGSYAFQNFTLLIDYVQGDPFAAPSRARVRVEQNQANFPDDTYYNRSREIALRDYLTRIFHRQALDTVSGNRGSGKSGKISIDRPGQEILERSSLVVTENYVEARFSVGLPAFGRKIAGKQATEMFLDELPFIVNQALFYKSHDSRSLYQHIKTAEDADSLRNQLKNNHYIAFIADGAILPRKSGVDPAPLNTQQTVAFKSPETDKLTLTLPNKGQIEGMAIPEGVNLICGGGYHGKSTVLEAIEQGIYNHMPGDGREFTVTDPDAVKIRAEDGRRIEKVRITPFISNLPLDKDTEKFSSDNASGSTSQAANIMEALETGAQVLLIDEDTSATNFMIRDHRMQELVAKEREPITPFIDKVRQMYRDHGVSTILVIGGSGDYFDVADNVFCMYNYLPYNVTEEARKITEKHKTERKPEGGEHFGELNDRFPKPAGLEPGTDKKPAKIKTRGLYQISFDKQDIDLSAVEQIIDTSQTRAMGDAILYALKYIRKGCSIRETAENVTRDIEEHGLDVIIKKPNGDYAVFRKLELAAAINRLPSLRIKT